MANIENKLPQSVPLTKKIDSKLTVNDPLLIKNDLYYKNTNENKKFCNSSKSPNYIINNILLSSQSLLANPPTSTNKSSNIVKRIGKQFVKQLQILKPLVYRQHFYAHCLKLVVLFITAILHLYYIQSFLSTLSILEDYSVSLDSKLHKLNKFDEVLQSPTSNIRLLQNEVEVFIDYKKSVWMAVAAMCVAFSTSCFFLFILPISCSIRDYYILLIDIIDIISFGTLLSLMIARIELISHITEFLPGSLLAAHHQLSAERLMNVLQCTIYPREKLVFCSEKILSSILPIIILKYLIILCLISLAYLMIAYLIEYCIKHHFQNYNCDILQCKNKCDNSYFGFCVPKYRNTCYPECTFCNENNFIVNKNQLWKENLCLYNNKMSQDLKNSPYLPTFYIQAKSVPKCSAIFDNTKPSSIISIA